jgi:hypothetical protein
VGVNDASSKQTGVEVDVDRMPCKVIPFPVAVRTAKTAAPMLARHHIVLEVGESRYDVDLMAFVSPLSRATAEGSGSAQPILRGSGTEREAAVVVRAVEWSQSLRRGLSGARGAFMDCGPEGRQSVDEDLRQEIGKLRQSKVKELRAQYRNLFGEESPSGNRMHLFRRVAWRLQARDAGQLSEQARQRAAQLADDADLRVRAPRDFWRLLERAGHETAPGRDPRLPAAGTDLKRTYRGTEILVRVEEDGFTYQKRRYNSLSAIAYEVTGTRWNGYLFFRLQEGQIRE